MVNKIVNLHTVGIYSYTWMQRNKILHPGIFIAILLQVSDQNVHVIVHNKIMSIIKYVST